MTKRWAICIGAACFAVAIAIYMVLSLGPELDGIDRASSEAFTYLRAMEAEGKNPDAVAALRAEHRTLNVQRDSLGMLRDILVLVVSGLGGLGIVLGGIEFMKDNKKGAIAAALSLIAILIVIAKFTHAFS